MPKKKQYKDPLAGFDPSAEFEVNTHLPDPVNIRLSIGRLDRRSLYAMAAMQEFLRHSHKMSDSPGFKTIAADSFKLADAMLEAEPRKQSK